MTKDTWISLYTEFENERGLPLPSPVVRGRDPKFYDETLTVYSKAVRLPRQENNTWFHLFQWGDDRWPSGREMKWVSTAYLFHFIYEGTGTANGVPVSAGMGFVVSPTEAYHIVSSAEEPLRFYWCLIYSETPLSFLTEEWVDKRGIFDFSFCFDSVCRLFRKGLFLDGNEQFVSCGIYGLFFEIISRCCSRSDVAEAARSPIVRRAVEYIRANYASDISVQALADILHISRAHLRRLFVSELGMAPKEWITYCRMEAAVALMNGKEEQSLTSIATAVGFSCYSQFVRAFRQVYGCVPRDYQVLAAEE